MSLPHAVKNTTLCAASIAVRVVIVVVEGEREKEREMADIVLVEGIGPKATESVKGL